MFGQSGLLLSTESGRTTYLSPVRSRAISSSCLNNHLPCSQAHCLKRPRSGIIGISDEAMIMWSFLGWFALPEIWRKFEPDSRRIPNKTHRFHVFVEDSEPFLVFSDSAHVPARLTRLP